jgi:glycerol-3-phosphate dehydrogenase
MLSAELRRRNLGRLQSEPLDVLIIGGGINGAGVARDLALRARHAGVPLEIGLVEKRHFASGTSGKNSQLIHGGLRYLKYFEFSLVRESLRERTVLLKLAPHLVEPLPFLIPIFSRFGRLFYGAGLWMYDLLAGTANIGRHRPLSRADVAGLEPGLSLEGLAGGAIFHDCRVHSARLVVENIADAARHGAIVANYVKAETRERTADGGWTIGMADQLTGERWRARARKIVDACGPWGNEGSLRLVRGSHIVLPRLTSGDRAVAHFDEAGRIVFFIPWGAANQLTLAGTTDVDHTAGPEDVRISEDEARYLLGIARRLFPAAGSMTPISAYSSLRPLLPDEAGSPTAASREHRIWNSPDGVLHIAGGKYTTYRVMSEQAADAVTEEIAPALGSVHLTASTPFQAPLPRIEDLPPEEQVEQAVNREMAQRLADVLFVSTYVGYERTWNETALAPYAEAMAKSLGWTAERTAGERRLVLNLVRMPY